MTDRVKVWNKTGGRCWYCGVELQTWDHTTDRIAPDTFCIDHVLPKIQGGTGVIENLVPSCWACNNKKKAMTLEDYRYKLGFELAYGETDTPRFTKEQRDWLESRGVELPQPFDVIFWGEE